MKKMIFENSVDVLLKLKKLKRTSRSYIFSKSPEL